MKRTPSARPAILVTVAAAFTIVGALCYWTPWENALPAKADQPAAPAATHPPVVSAAPAQQTALPMIAPDDTDDGDETPVRKTVNSTAKQLTKEEKAAVQRQIDGAEAEVARLKIQNRKSHEVFDDDSERAEFVTVDAFTEAQFDAFFTFLTKQGRVFTPGSAAAIAFREKADDLVLDMREYTHTAFLKRTPKKPGPPNFVIIDLPEDAPFPAFKKGVVSISAVGVRSRIPDSGQNAAFEAALEKFFADGPISGVPHER